MFKYDVSYIDLKSKLALDKDNKLRPNKSDS